MWERRRHYCSLFFSRETDILIIALFEILILWVLLSPRGARPVVMVGIRLSLSLSLSFIDARKNWVVVCPCFLSRNQHTKYFNLPKHR